jgi:peptide/nickel transport system ATP-binding protein
MRQTHMAETDMGKTSSVLEITGLTVDFGSQDRPLRVLDGINLDLQYGRVLGVVGESGCGKSMTARAILQIIERPGRIVSGQIILDPGTPQELDLARLDPAGKQIRAVRGRRVGFIFQEPMTALSNHYTIGNQIIESVLQNKATSPADARQRTLKLLHDVGIPNPEMRVDAFPFQLSGGLRQRVGIALALAGDPDILIADEPTTALDVTTQAQILNLLRNIQQEKQIALMLITHDMGVIAEMADDVAVMYLGRIAEVGSVDQIFANPQHPYTKALLRSVPSMNASPRQRLATIGGVVPSPSSRPSGCPFHPRCPEIILGRCETELPPAVGPGCLGSSCWRTEVHA